MMDDTVIAGRVFIGIGQGLALTAGSVYIGELAPQEIRGKIMTFWQMFYSVGSFIAYWVRDRTRATLFEHLKAVQEAHADSCGGFR